MSEIQTIIEEAKRGILTISDFYKDEVFGYFMAQAVMNAVVGLCLFIPIFIMNKLHKKAWFYDDGDIEPGGMVYIVGSLFTTIFGLFLFFIGVHNMIMLIVAPKIFITTELVNLFK